MIQRHNLIIVVEMKARMKQDCNFTSITEKMFHINRNIFADILTRIKGGDLNERLEKFFLTGK
jgi:hypothetical protein